MKQQPANAVQAWCNALAEEEHTPETFEARVCST